MEKQFYLTVTPLGALHAVKPTSFNQVTRSVLLMLLSFEESPLLSDELMLKLTGFDEKNLKLAQAIFYQLQTLHYVQSEFETVKMPSYKLETDLASILGLLSSMGKSLLTDEMGFAMGNSGFLDNQIDEIAATSTKLADVYLENDEIISSCIGHHHSSVGIMNYQGMNQLGVFVLDIGGSRFTLTILGVPFLNQKTFRDLVWVLVYRYGSNDLTINKH